MASERHGWPGGPEGERVFGIKLDLTYATFKLVSIKLTVCDELRNIFISPAMSCGTIGLYSLLRELRCQFVKCKLFLNRFYLFI